MSRAETSPLRRDAAENRRRVLAAAEVVFAETGLQASVDAVIDAAGVGTGTFYRRFPNKEALVDELVAEMIDHIIGLARQALAAHGADGTALEHYLYAAGQYSESKAALSQRLWAEGAHGRISPQRQSSLDAGLADLLDAARRAGLVDADLSVADVRDAIRAVTGITNAAGSGSGDWRRHMRIWVAGIRPPAVRSHPDGFGSLL